MRLVAIIDHRIVPLPMEEIQLDFKDATSMPPDSDGKQQHAVEICNFVDAGTSTWLLAETRSDFHAETALEAVVHFLTHYGRPCRMTFDRDSRWVGSHSLRHFPSAFCRFLLCLDIQPNICPPRRPDKNPYVERLHRTLNQECLQVRLPTTLGEVREVTTGFLWHYNHERPQEAKSLWQSSAACCFPKLTSAAATSRAHQPGSLARHHPWASVCQKGGHRWRGGRG